MPPFRRLPENDMKFNIILLALFFALVGVIFSLPEEKTASVSSTVRDAFAVPQAGLRRAAAWIKSVGADNAALAHENMLLRARIEQLNNAARQNMNIHEENRKLRDMLRLKEVAGSNLIAARLLTRNVNGWWRTARIDKGAGDGVAAGMPVINHEGLIGQIVEVSGSSSDVLFLTSPKVRVAARLARSGVFGIVRGLGESLEGDARCRMDFIVKDADINRADQVITSGLGGVYPEGLVIGYIDEVRMDSSGLFRQAEVAPAADLRMIDLVFVVAPGGGGNGGREAGGNGDKR